MFIRGLWHTITSCYMTPLCSFFRTSNEGLKMTRAFSSVYCNPCFLGGVEFFCLFGFFCCTGINLQWCPRCVYKTLNIYLIKSLWEKALSPSRFFCANVREEWSVVWGWEVILCVNELGDSNSCCFGMRARFSICSPLGEWEDEELCRMVE